MGPLSNNKKRVILDESICLADINESEESTFQHEWLSLDLYDELFQTKNGKKERKTQSWNFIREEEKQDQLSIESSQGMSRDFYKE